MNLPDRKYIQYSANNYYRHSVKDEIDAVEELANNMLAGKNEKRALFLNGARGAGKTWSCLHLKRTVFSAEKYKDLVLPFLIRFWPIPEDEIKTEINEWWLSEKKELHNNQDEQVFYDLVSALEDTFQLPHIENQDWEFRIRQIILSVDEGKKIFLLIIDSVNEGVMQGYESLFNRIQSYLLAPLLNTSRCVVILTGRGASPSFRSFYLRDMEAVDIGHLSLDAVRKVLFDYENPLVKDQPREVALTNIQTVFDISGGYALLVRLIAQQTTADLKIVMEKVQKEIIPISTDDRSIIDGLEKISVLSVPFRDSDVLPLFADILTQDEAFTELRKLRENLLKQSLLEWDTDNKGYQVSPSVLHFYRETLCRYKPEKFRKYTLILIENFQRIIKSYPDQPEVRDYYSNQSEILQKRLENDCAKEVAL